jgi:sugar/nucleoside kinase (ribokinase family)
MDALLDLVCLGNVTIDDVVLPDGRTRMGCFGGDAIYAALAASYWTSKVQFVAPIGKDFSQANLEMLKKLGWNLHGMPRRNSPGIRNWTIYEYDGRRTWIDRGPEKDFYLLSPKFADIPQDYRSTKAHLLLAMDLKATEELVVALKGSGALIALDPQEDYILGNQKMIFDMLKGVDIFLPSQIEVERLVGHTDYRRAIRELASLGCRVVAIKLGAEGSIIYDKESDQLLEIPIYPTKVVDTTGAGDSFSGGFMAMYVQSQNLVKSGLAGAVSSSLAIEGFGLSSVLKRRKRSAHQRFRSMMESWHASHLE